MLQVRSVESGISQRGAPHEGWCLAALGALLALSLTALACGGDPAAVRIPFSPYSLDVRGDGEGSSGDDTVGLGKDTLQLDATPGASGFSPDFGEACTGNGDCESGLCVHSRDGEVCTDTCVDECPTGYACKQVLTPSRDVQFACLPLHVTACRPCTDASVCVDGGYQDKAICHDFGAAGRFCATPCDASTACLDGYSCTELGGSAYCLPTSGQCDCDAVAKVQGLSTACSLVNEAGTCPGLRTCGDAGLGPCEGRTPADETCNDLDDDCDGQTDEGFTEKGTACDGPDLDECKDGVTVCGPNGVECADDAAAASEACDNDKDDDCDGETDEGCCNTLGAPCCANGQCGEPYVCKFGVCGCDQKTKTACIDGDAWWVDCTGAPTIVSKECGTCGCEEGACKSLGDDQTVCSASDVWSTDCQGNAIEQVKDCGLCACSAGACLESAAAGVACFEGDAWSVSCDGTPTTKFADCGLCACAGNACALSNQAAKECFSGDSWWTDCFGNPTSKAKDCGACSCAGGECLEDETAERICQGGDAWWTDCNGQATIKADDCGTCG